MQKLFEERPQKLFNNILVIGAGGTGSILLPSLTRFLYAVKYKGTLTIADGDKYEDKNLDRQIFSKSQTGMNKAEYQTAVIHNHIPEFKDQVFAISKYLSKKDIEREFDEEALVINCVDNKACRTFVEKRLGELKNAAHICCGNTMRSGQVQLALRLNGEWITPTIFEESPDLEDTSDDVSKMDCQELSALEGGGQIVAANMMAASLALCYITQIMGGYPVNKKGTFIHSAYTYFDVLMNVFENRSTKELVLC